MYTASSEQYVQERQLKAEADTFARRIRIVRRRQREFERANHQVQLTRLAVR